MKNIIWNVLAVVLGIVVGGVVNMCLVMIGPHVIPTPAGVDMTTVEGLNAGMKLLEPQHFVFPFLAHALGTFAGAFVGALIAASHRMVIALIVGAFNLLGGIMAATMIPAPMWFIALDLIVAYIPMAWIAGTIAKGLRREQVATQMA
jgi:hypothetical protein